jgi:hypothetical protein
MDIIKITPDKERARSILKMVSLLEERIKQQDKRKMAALIITDYYEIIKELITAILLIDGYKTLSHKDLVDYLKEKYPQFGNHEIEILSKLRILRNRVTYEGFLINPDYLTKNELYFLGIIKKLKILINSKVSL